jgi:hypothetical protein
VHLNVVRSTREVQISEFGADARGLPGGAPQAWDEDLADTEGNVDRQLLLRSNNI